MNTVFFFFYKLAGGLATPPGCFFALLFLLTVTAHFKIKERAAKKLNAMMFFVVVIMYLLFTPFVAGMMMGFLETSRPELPNDGVPTLVAVLAGGGTHPVLGAESDIELAEQSYQRLSEGIKLAKLKGWPLIYSGSYDEGDVAEYESALSNFIRQSGMENDFMIDSASRNTWENFREISKIAHERKIGRVIISTTAFHMKRSLWMAKKQIPDLEIVPWPSGWKSTRGHFTINLFAPSARAFLDSCTAIREMIGLAVYSIAK